MKVFNSLYNFIRNLFNKNKFINNEVIIKDEVVDSYSKLYSEIEVGDIIWGKRYFKEKDKKKIIKGHREGPFIIVHKFDNKLICIQGTGVDLDENIYDYFYLNDDGYNLSKETYFYLDNLKVLDDFSFIKKMDKLRDEDKNNLFRKLKIIGKNYFNIDNKYYKFKLPLQCGDIVCSDNKNFIIIDILDNKLFVVPFNNGRVTGTLKLQMFESLDYSKVCCLENDEKVEFVNIIDSNRLLYILKKYQEYVENNKNKCITQRGSIISKNNRYYYVYGEEGQYWLVFEFFKNNKSNLERIKVKDNIVYTNFKDIKIDKKDNFDTIDLCMKDEINKIKSTRKSYRKKCEEVNIYNNVSLQSQFSKIGVGDIVKSKKYNNVEFFVSDIIGNMVVCINSVELGLVRPQKVYFNKTELSVVKKVKKRQKNR